MMKKQIYLIGVSYKKSPVEIREKFALSSNQDIFADHIARNTSGIEEYLVLSTCNRVEIIAVANALVQNVPEQIAKCWAEACNMPLEILREHMYVYSNLSAITHICNVASSLDSMVLGEPQILGQLKDAYRDSVKNQTAKVILNRLLHKAFSVAKRVRFETAIASSAVSISYAAVELAKKIFDSMESTKVMLIGAGEMAELAATHLLNAGTSSIVVVNRTYERAVQLAEEYKGVAAYFEDIFDELANVDIIISSTGSTEPIIYAENIRNVLKKRKNKPMFFIDIAVPRDIAPDVNTLDNIYLYDIDDLKEVVEENLAGRRDEAEKARLIIEEEAENFSNWIKSLHLQPTIVDLIKKNERFAFEELEKTLKKIGPVNDDVKDALNAMIGSILKKVNHEPIAFLKRKFQENSEQTQHINLVRRIFNLDNEIIPDRPHYGRYCKNCDLVCTSECRFHPKKIIAKSS